jgi:hypothetical protein
VLERFSIPATRKALSYPESQLADMASTVRSRPPAELGVLGAPPAAKSLPAPEGSDFESGFNESLWFFGLRHQHRACAAHGANRYISLEYTRAFY